MTKNWKFRNSYGRMIRRMRTGGMKSQEELAKQIGVSTSYISQIELGKVIPGKRVKDQLDRLIELYEVA